MTGGTKQLSHHKKGLYSWGRDLIILVRRGAYKRRGMSKALARGGLGGVVGVGGGGGGGGGGVGVGGGGVAAKQNVPPE